MLSRGQVALAPTASESVVCEYSGKSPSQSGSATYDSLTIDSRLQRWVSRSVSYCLRPLTEFFNTLDIRHSIYQSRHHANMIGFSRYRLKLPPCAEQPSKGSKERECVPSSARKALSLPSSSV